VTQELKTGRPKPPEFGPIIGEVLNAKDVVATV
jgi:hypothetical protein